MHDLKIIVQRNNDAAKRMLGVDYEIETLAPDEEKDQLDKDFDESETSKKTS
jgi:hypothetical protein